MKTRLGRRLSLCFFTWLAIGCCARIGSAQVKDVTVGITPTCPYGLSACWGGAAASLRMLPDVDSIGANSDAYNCTASIYLTNPGLPNVDRWREDFQKSVGQLYIFRGVEVTVEAELVAIGDKIALKSPGLKQPLVLAPLKHKLQWNFKKRQPREPEPGELAAFDELVKLRQSRAGEPLLVQVTGPLQSASDGPVMEVREYFVSKTLQ